jgi:hypothetical protein
LEAQLAAALKPEQPVSKSDISSEFGEGDDEEGAAAYLSAWLYHITYNG